ncbi:cytochrome bd oxidase small subunit CydS [Texcoconibacillus texcoconensis]|uniref:Uncharacterized protein n=1 Tax=Texcoconibacillus texcoconensis TaxID=1095777 RepID=A0A840QPH3_9BACI|nr:hypothetical protein [Texcoconibacillus texcoconensis]MBB5173274.1 hypothetical protein [Texcoconibacillus texcoconensis]
MDMSWFLIMIASPLILIASIAFPFIWGAKAKTPDWLKEEEKQKQ